MKKLALRMYGSQEMDAVEVRKASKGNSIAREVLKWLWRIIRDSAAYEVLLSQQPGQPLSTINMILK